MNFRSLPVLTALAALVLCSSDIAKAATIHVFLVGGQSNADGRALASGLPTSLQNPQSDVPFYYATNVGLTTLSPVSAGSVVRFGPEITFGRSMADIYASSGDSVAILKHARGATNLNADWAAGGDATTVGDGSVYMDFQNTISSGLMALQAANPSATISINGMLWVQGEQDITDARSGGPAPTAITDYADNLTRFIADVRATFAPEMSFLFSQISDNQTVFSNPADPDYANYLELRAQQASVANTVTGATLINIDGEAFTMKDDFLHFDAGGQQALGDTFAAAAQAVPEPTVSGLCAAGGILVIARTRRRSRLVC